MAITYVQGSRTSGLLRWVGMGAAKAALEFLPVVSQALANRGMAVNAISPGRQGTLC